MVSKAVTGMVSKPTMGWCGVKTTWSSRSSARPLTESSGSRASSAASISTKVTSPWPMHTASAEAPCRNSSGTAEGNQPPHQMGRCGYFSRTALLTLTPSKTW